MPGTNRIPDEAGSMTHAKIPEPVNTETNTDWNTGTNEPVQAMPSRRCDNHSGNAWTGLMDTAIPEPVKAERTKSILLSFFYALCTPSAITMFAMNLSYVSADEGS